MKKKPSKRAKLARPSTKADPNRFPKGWDQKRVESVVAHYEGQTDEQATAEDEAAYRSTTSTMIEVPLRLVQKVEKLIARAS
jgi:hypothetical protein